LIQDENGRIPYEIVTNPKLKQYLASIAQGSLFLAIMLHKGDINTFKWLLRAGASFTGKNLDGYTPLEIALKYNNLMFLEFERTIQGVEKPEPRGTWVGNTFQPVILQ